MHEVDEAAMMEVRLRRQQVLTGSGGERGSRMGGSQVQSMPTYANEQAREIIARAHTDAT